MTGDSGCGAWPQPLLSCTTSLSIAIFVNVLFSAFRVGALEQPRKVTDFFFSAKLFRQKIVGKVVRLESVPGRCPASFSKASAKLQTFAVTSKCFYNFFLRKISPRHATPCKPTGYNHKKKLTKPYPITTSQFKASIATISLPTKPPKNYTIKYLNNLFYVKNTPI